MPTLAAIVFGRPDFPIARGQRPAGLCVFVALALLAAAAPPARPGLTGLPFLSTWDSRDYGGTSGNFSLVQHPRTGLMYLGSNTGVFEFDGATWRGMDLPGRSVVPIVVIDAQDTIWLGGTNTVAILQPNELGELQPVELTARLPESEQGFGRLYLGAAGVDGVYLASPTHLLHFRTDGSVQTWRSGPTHFNGVCRLDGALHVSRGNRGLARLVDGDLVDVAPPPPSPNPAVADTLRLFAAQRVNDRTDAILLTDAGPMRWAGPGGAMVPLTVSTNAWFAQDNAVAASFLHDGRMVFALRRQGLLVLDATGGFSALIDSARGLPRGLIQDLAADDQGGLWLAQSDGVTRLQFESRFATQPNLNAVRTLQRHRDRLYLSDETGVVWRDDATGELHAVSGFPSPPASLVKIGDRLFGTGQYLREITAEDEAKVVLPVQLNSLAPMPTLPGTFLAGSVRGLRILHFDGEHWSDGGVVSGVRGGARAVLADPHGFAWVEGYQGADSWRVDFRAGANLDAPVMVLDAAAGLPDPHGGRTHWLSGSEGELRVVRGGVMLRFDRDAERFEPEAWPDGVPALERVSLAENESDGLWGYARNPSPQIVRLIPDAGQRWRAELFPASPLIDSLIVTQYFDSPTRTLWIATRGSPITMDADWHAARVTGAFGAVIRGLSTATGELLLGGAGVAAATREAAPALRLAPEQNSLRFAFSAPSYVPDSRGTLRTVYRSRLEGVERTWSVWSPTPWREFTDLPYRRYAFHVQARDLEGRISTVDTLAFVVAPPWWLSRPMLVLYVLGAALIGGGIFRLRTRALQHRNAELEAIVSARTAELERLRRLEMDEKISARLAEQKARLEVLRYQLNPHFLFNSLNSIYTLVWSHSRPAGDLVRRLAEFCRMTLTRRDAETATLAEEFKMLRAYLELEQLRWHENLTVELTLAPAIESTRLPPFLLLPLVENAVKYGGHTSADLLGIRVEARPESEKCIVIEVANTGRWIEPGSKPEVASGGIGLDNLRQRLMRHYPESHEFGIAAADGWVTVRLRLGACRVLFESVGPADSGAATPSPASSP